ncbi:hypothetical protein HYDPIDRAFT_112732 [Hydnomerulius pinastri MD-312]|uniref:G domain-containing protein n=1 Tax=Hydnomerulius pinastri MD-312 TaxID=994086 RepID=A0A0C9W8H2_9AGAM|nr:hypothetical protein HYDPIDRAFT_112732 [Hydnomerulius pinastri MD-312]
MLFSKVKVDDILDTDVVIAFMGPTGSGKSNFINQLTGLQEERGAGGLQSCTQDVMPFKTQYKGRQLVFVDTPGFDDTYKSDSEILRLIANWLEKTYRGHVKLSGVIYLHRITDNRMSGSVCKNLTMFCNLCGDTAANRVRLVTTMWDKAKDRRVAEDRETQLKGEFWEPLIRQKAVVARFENTGASAWGIIDDLIAHGDAKEALLLQEELVEVGVRLNETTAGKALYSRFQQLLVEQREMTKQLSDEAAAQDNPALAKELRAEYDRIDAQLQTTFEELKRMKIPLSRRIILFFSFKKTRSRAIRQLSLPN